MAELRKPVFREDSARSETAELEAVPAVAILQEAMETAVRFRASDIHLEPVRSGVRIRMRIDGRLSVYARYNEAAYPALQAALIARAKVLTGMDISEKRRPQDGRMTFGFGETEVDVRASSLPTAGGEKIALRFFYQEIWCRSLRELGLSGEERKIFREILSRPYGLVLVTGPTGSGKSTTLYTVLDELNREEVNIVTVEEPVEVRLDGISQIPVNTRAGLTFASALRSLLRQDPDIVMVGEIRDRETAEIAVQAALTGRLVLSTLHTGSATGSITRLLDLGVEPYLIADALTGVAAQRLVRVLCDCKKEREATEEEKKLLRWPEEEKLLRWSEEKKLSGKMDKKKKSPRWSDEEPDNKLEEKPEKEVSGLTICDPCGCEKCHGTGYRGRTGIFEVMQINSAIRSEIRRCSASSKIRKMSYADGRRTLREQAGRLVLEKVTSMEEYRRFLWEEEEE